MATIIESLWFVKGSIFLPGKTIPCWGFSRNNQFPQVPGPLIEAEAGNDIFIVLLNSFLNENPVNEPTSIYFPGQENVMASSWPYFDFQPVQPQFQDDILVSLTNYLEPGDYQSSDALIYRFKATRPGIFLYESGTNPEKQIQMGAYGILNIHPVGYNLPEHPSFQTAYGSGTESEYDIQKILVLGEFDSQLHDSVVPGEYYNMLNFNPDNWVINGRAYPDTIEDDFHPGQLYNSTIICNPGDRVLLRLINAGFITHTFSLGQFEGKIIAEDSYPLVNAEQDISYYQNSITLAAGQSIDLIIIPEEIGEYILYSRRYNHLVNNEQFPGGMMTRLEVINPENR